MPCLRLLAPLLASLFIAGLLACSAQADTLLRIDTRPGVQVPVYEMLNPAAHATLVLLPGGHGGFGKLVDGAPSSQNFLVRERQRFVDAGFHVAVVSRPSDIPDLDNGTRTGEAHLADLLRIREWQRAGLSLDAIAGLLQAKSEAPLAPARPGAAA